MAPALPTQEKHFPFLKNPESYSHHPEQVKITQTHASVLAIASPFVYKLKKPYDFGFMDFRTLESRKENFEKEIQLNRRLCKDTYLELVPVSESGGTFFFGKQGKIVDYALKMKQLKEGFFLNQLLEKGKINTDLLDKILHYLKEFYEKQPENPAILPFGDISHLRKNTEENFRSLQQLKHKVIAPEALHALQKLTNSFYLAHPDLFEQRMAEGKIKDCHGDLHLEHIHLYQEKICIFDCIEFNDRFRYIDVAADIAFLSMDFDFSGKPEFAQYVAIKLARLMNDPGLLKLIDFYKNYRACVRAKVEGIKSEQEDVSNEEKAQSREKAVRYVQLALSYAVTGSSPMAMVVCGRVASGKSSIAKKLSELLGASYISSDICRKEMAGIPLYQEATPEQKATLYSEAKKGETYRLLLENTLKELSQHKNVIVDATFSKKSQRRNFRESLKERKISFCFLEAQASEQVIKERLEKRTHSKAISDARPQDFEMLNQSFEKVEELPQQEYLRLNTEDRPEKTIEKALLALGSLKLL